jgi:hypothetical protein
MILPVSGCLSSVIFSFFFCIFSLPPPRLILSL